VASVLRQIVYENNDLSQTANTSQTLET